MKIKGTLCAFFALLLLVVLIVPSIVSSRVYASDGVAWTKYQGNPLNMGLARVVEPWVIYDGSTFKMWYTGITDAHRIYYATSPDGINWTPEGMVLDKGGPGSWDEHQVRNPVVLFDGASYRMWYSGYIYGTAKIGFATSPDGIHWTKYDQNPVLVAGGNGGWDDYTVGAFTVMLEGSKYWMWYNGVRAEGGSQQIGVATSLDGVSWTKYSANPVLVPGPNEWDNYHIYTGPVLKSEGLYRMWYTGQSWATNRVGLATSSDGYSWSKYEVNPVLDVGPSGAWDSGYVFATTVLEVRGNLLMWYWGFTYQASGNVQIGLAMAIRSPTKWTVVIDPETLNLRSKGKWITVYIELPGGYYANEIDVSTVVLNGTVPAEQGPTAIDDYDGDGVPDLMVKFDRAAVQQYILNSVDLTEHFIEVTLTVTGYLDDGTPFQGNDTIRVVSPVWYWKVVTLEKLGIIPE